MEKIIGIVPARMGSSRFPGKPLYHICGRPMVEHVFRRAQFFERWDGLFLATCDEEIKEFGEAKGFPVIMTSDSHTRCLDRVAEAVEKSGSDAGPNDIVVCVQGDEPMLRPDMIEKVIQPLMDDASVDCAVLAMQIVDDEQFRDPNTVKIIKDMNGDVLYTSRSPVPHCEKLTSNLDARRIYGILGFRWHFLRFFNSMPESPLELAESCDSNRICDNGLKQRIAPYPYIESFSVDTPEDMEKVEEHMKNDPFLEKY
ncbi:3-deoxy-manno-octulosonate cytidylyltransferase [Candidatus Desulfarcum epimagneticum]|uniref:3-deoxy-manno-octulosonate cytidylyltransferase n=1 Tax=uncultured Desulfobacteraceae bacterium TaxID=218296 RepID=A0A484HMF8_9BACT|nr:3-deoxy-manno-octulosonate cytidylyltransferase [uncultured Desulfobacteraceae bacterium]